LGVAAPTEFVLFDLEHTAWSPGTPSAVRHLRNVSAKQKFVDLLSTSSRAEGGKSIRNRQMPADPAVDHTYARKASAKAPRGAR
jgi:hypothetical protein